MHRMIAAVLITFVMFALMSTDGHSAAGKNNHDDEDLIENAIIVDSLSLTSDKPTESVEQKEGEVIYDDEFDDGLKLAEKVSEKNRIGSHNKGKDDLLSSLQVKDKRWHLSRYEIKKGDTLWEIARRYQTSHKLIIRANQITGADSLRPGKNILIPNRIGVT
ncbi:MAG TPA: LysM peptidoglycan-binding domain-containing protein, partial [Spirochaetota bacterium]